MARNEQRVGGGPTTAPGYAMRIGAGSCMRKDLPTRIFFGNRRHKNASRFWTAFTRSRSSPQRALLDTASGQPPNWGGLCGRNDYVGSRKRKGSFAWSSAPTSGRSRWRAVAGWLVSRSQSQSVSFCPHVSEGGLDGRPVRLDTGRRSELARSAQGGRRRRLLDSFLHPPFEGPVGRAPRPAARACAAAAAPSRSRGSSAAARLPRCLDPAHPSFGVLFARRSRGCGLEDRPPGSRRSE